MRDSPPIATITPRPDVTDCEATECEETELLALVEPDASEESRVLCPQHRVEYLNEVYAR